MSTHRKQRQGAPHGFFACEAAGLDWLRVPGGPPVVEVLDVGADHLDLARLTPVTPDPAAAQDFGARLAVLHDAGAPAFGSPPAGWSGDGFFGPLDQPMPMRSGSWSHWGEFLAEARIEPMIEDLRPDDDTRRGLDHLVTRLRAGDWDDDDPPARLHGDLWSGNLLWTADGVTLIDPAAHGGHRESDLAMLALFGAPHLDRIFAGYQSVHPLRRGWRHRIALHQLYPVGMHVLLFGGGYSAQFGRLVADMTKAPG